MELSQMNEALGRTFVPQEKSSDIEKQIGELFTPINKIHRDPIKTTEALLHERGKTHGDFSVHAQITQDLKNIMRSAYKVTPASDVPINAWAGLTKTQAESLDMIVHKIGRILAGDADFRDHWDDIAGYAKLSADLCSK